MTHKEVYEHFKNEFKDISKCSTEWEPYGKNSILIKTHDGVSYSYTFNKPGDWIFQTVIQEEIKMTSRVKDFIDLCKPFDPTTDDGAKRMAVDIGILTMAIIADELSSLVVYYFSKKNESKLLKRVHELEQKVDQLQK